MMKKSMMMFALLIAFALSANAQIQRTFLDNMVIDKTTLAEATPALEKLGFSINDYGNWYEGTAYNIEIDGTDWSWVVFKFSTTDNNPDDPVLTTVTLRKIEILDLAPDGEYSAPERALFQKETIDSIGVKMLGELTEKYGQYITSKGDEYSRDDAGLKFVVFKDGETELMFYRGITAGMPESVPYEVQLEYNIQY